MSNLTKQQHHWTGQDASFVNGIPPQHDLSTEFIIQIHTTEKSKPSDLWAEVEAVSSQQIPRHART